MPKRKQGKRKQPGAHTAHGPSRVPEEAGELFAVVRQLMGGPHIRVTCSDGKERLCMIRRKFRGRHKRGNEVSPGTLILVGLYDWVVSNNTKGPQCDLLHVYSRDQTRTFTKKSVLSKALVALLAAAGDAQAVCEDDADLVFSGELPANSDAESLEFSSASDDEDELAEGEANATEAPSGTLLSGPEVHLADI